MILLILGVLLWSGLHLLPAVGRGPRATIVARIGEGPYKGLFALSLVGAIVLMTLGWRATPPTSLYATPSWGFAANQLVMFVALVLFLGSNVPTNLKRIVRHPQLTGFTLWALGHLAANGETRSVVLFGGLALWAGLEIWGLNRRDGAWEKPDPLPLAAEAKPLVAAIVVYAVLVFAHPWISGRAAFPG